MSTLKIKTASKVTAENAKRVSRIDKIVTRYLLESGCEEDNFVRDILSDIRHYCDACGISFSEEDRVAYQNYLAEKTGGNHE